MAIEVRVPTILRGFTGGAKAVEAVGGSLAEVIDEVDDNHPGVKDRIIEGRDLRRFINVYVNDEDVRFTGGLGTQVADGDVVVILPAVAGGALRHDERIDIDVAGATAMPILRFDGGR